MVLKRPFSIIFLQKKEVLYFSEHGRFEVDFPNPLRKSAKQTLRGMTLKSATSSATTGTLPLSLPTNFFDSKCLRMRSSMSGNFFSSNSSTVPLNLVVVEDALEVSISHLIETGRGVLSSC